MKPKEIRNLIIIIIIGVVIIGILSRSKKADENVGTSFNGTQATSDVEIDDVTFSEITKVYEDGITTLSAKMMNNTDEIKAFKIKISLRDDNGNEVQNMIQVVEDLEPGRAKVFTTGIMGDYSYVENVSFEVVE